MPSKLKYHYATREIYGIGSLGNDLAGPLCGRFDAPDPLLTKDKSEVECKRCLKLLEQKKSA